MNERDGWDVFDEIRRIIESSMMLPFIFSTGRIPVRGEHAKSERPYYDMVETDEEVVLTLELPSVKKESIIINASEDVFEVSVEDRKEGGYKSKYEGFHGAYKTPSPINPKKVRAKYKNGVLEVRAQKASSGKKRGLRVF